MKTLRVVSMVMSVLASAGLAWSQDVGVVKGRNGCPVGSQEVWFHMDNEDTNEESSVSGWVGAISLDSAGNVRYPFCRVPASLLASAPGKFMVLQLSDNCPSGKARLYRHFDNENHDNRNSTSGPIGPNYSSRGFSETGLYFCIMSGGTGSFPNLGVEYGVIATQYEQPSALARGDVFNDDENTWPGTNNNYYNYSAAGHTYWEGRSRSHPGVIVNGIDGSQNTGLHIAKVGVTMPPTRPSARCTNSPTYGNIRVDSTFSDAGSTASSGRTLTSWQWSWGDGTSASGPGPHTRSFYHYSGPSGSSRTYTGTLTVTDNMGESSSATCSVIVYFP
jgi:hypothetical protein